LIAGIGLYTELAMIGVIFYLIHDMLIKSNLLMITGLIQKIRETIDITRLGGLAKDYPKLSFIIAIALFSLIGIPPLSGFWPKIQFFGESIKAKEYVLLGAFIFASFVTLFVVARVWVEVFWKESPKPLTEEIDHFSNLNFWKKFQLVAPVTALSFVTLYIGLNAEVVYEIAQHTAQQLMNPSAYVEAVLTQKK
jgi:multicomponent Na+:H+ antiporter subunit D